MARAALVLTLTLMTAAGPWSLCCCAAAHFANHHPTPPQPAAPAPPDDEPPCCCCKHAEAPKPATPDPAPPAAPRHCRCRDHLPTAMLTPAEDGPRPTLAGWLSLPMADSVALPFASPGLSQLGEGRSASPGCSPRDQLHSLRVLRC
ncbi:MAG TPA: hypothetical protein VFA26_01475 [Gemmataceae bacterium]|nr:hypothetical protein [Gemmataceae bacterium]